MGLNQKTTALTDQALAESNESQVLIQAILGRLAGLDTMAGNISIIAEDAELTRHPITETAGNTTAATLVLQSILAKLNATPPLDDPALQAKLQAIIDLLADDMPQDLTPLIAAITALKEDTLALRDRATAIWQAQYTTLEEMQAHWDNTPISQLRNILQAILDALQAQTPLDGASIVAAIQAGTAETHEAVARLDYIGDQANLAAVKAAVLEVVARLDYIGDQANLAAVKAAIEALQTSLVPTDVTALIALLDQILWHMPRIEGDTDEIKNLSVFMREANDLSNAKLELIIGRLDQVLNLFASYPDMQSDMSSVRWLVQDIFNYLGLPMAGLTLGELLWNIVINTRALVPKDPQTTTPEPGMTLSHSTKMTLLPTGAIPYIGSYNVLVAGWDAPPAGTAFGLGQFNLPDNTVLTAPDGWAGWYIYTQSSGKNFAVTLASLQRYFTNEWMPMPTEVTNELHVYVEGTENIRVWLAQSAPSGGGGGDPGPTPDEWYAETMKLDGVQIDVTFPAQANSNFTGSQTYTSVDDTAVVCVCYGTLSQAVTFRSSDGSEWTVWNGDTILGLVDATGIVLGPYTEPMRIHVNAPDGANIGSVIMTSANWPTAFIPV